MGILLQTVCFYQQKKKEIEMGEEKLNHGQKSIATLATDLVKLESHLSTFRDKVMGHLNAHEKAKDGKFGQWVFFFGIMNLGFPRGKSHRENLKMRGGERRYSFFFVFRQIGS